MVIARVGLDAVKHGPSVKPADYPILPKKQPYSKFTVLTTTRITSYHFGDFAHSASWWMMRCVFIIVFVMPAFDRAFSYQGDDPIHPSDH